MWLYTQHGIQTFSSHKLFEVVGIGKILFFQKSVITDDHFLCF